MNAWKQDNLKRQDTSTDCHIVVIEEECRERNDDSIRDSTQSDIFQEVEKDMGEGERTVGKLDAEISVEDTLTSWCSGTKKRLVVIFVK